MLNISKISQELGFDEEDVVMLVEMFKESAWDSMTLLKEAIIQNNYDEIKQHAHSIKGSAANIMLDDIFNIAKSIENASIKKESIDYKTKFKQLHGALKSIKIAEAV